MRREAVRDVVGWRSPRVRSRGTRRCRPVSAPCVARRLHGEWAASGRRALRRRATSKLSARLSHCAPQSLSSRLPGSCALAPLYLEFLQREMSQTYSTKGEVRLPIDVALDGLVWFGLERDRSPPP